MIILAKRLAQKIMDDGRTRDPPTVNIDHIRAAMRADKECPKEPHDFRFLEEKILRLIIGGHVK